MKIAQNLDISEFLDSEEKISAYLTAIMEDNDLPLLLQAIGHIAKARGMATIAKDSGLGRESLYKAFNENSQPKFDTVKRVLNAMNISINFTPTTDPKSGANSPIRHRRGIQGGQSDSEGVQPLAIGPCGPMEAPESDARSGSAGSPTARTKPRRWLSGP